MSLKWYFFGPLVLVILFFGFLVYVDRQGADGGSVSFCTFEGKDAYCELLDDGFVRIYGGTNDTYGTAVATLSAGEAVSHIQKSYYEISP